MALDLPTLFDTQAGPATQENPQGTLLDDLIPGDGLGTPATAAPLNDARGFFQALLLNANISANGQVDNALASQYYDALRKLIKPEAADGFVSLGSRYEIVNRDILDIDSLTASADFSTYGPTDSGAVNIWSILDAIPLFATAIIFEVALSAEPDPSSTAKAGSLSLESRLPGSSSRHYRQLQATTHYSNAPHDAGVGTSNAVVSVDVGNRFDLWLSQSDILSSQCNMRVVGYYA